MKILLLLIFFMVCDAARILVLVPVHTRSHFNVFAPIVRELANRGHNITILSTVALPEPVNPRIQQLVITSSNGSVDTAKAYRRELFSTVATLPPYWQIINLFDVFAITCRKLLQEPEVIHLLNSKLTFDLVLLDALMCECVLPLVSLFDAPLIQVAPSNYVPWSNTAIGNPIRFHMESMFYTSTPVTLWQRVMAMIQGTLVYVYRDMIYIPHLERIAHAHIPAPHGHASLTAIEKERTSLVMVNTHFALTNSRPVVPGVIQIAGIHCKPANQLPQELEQFLNGSGDAGFIYFSLGGTISSEMMPEAIRLAFLEAFRYLPQRVLWKWNGNMSDAPSNVLLVPWAPQQDILGHKQLKVFITQGGMLSLQEAVYHAVPILATPIILDQQMNSDHVVQAGYGIKLDFLSVTQNSIRKVINLLLHEPKYKRNAKKLSAIFRDQSESPLERAVWWTEYVLRHKGSLHLRGNDVNLHWYQQQALDIVAIFILTVIIFGITLSKCLKMLYRTMMPDNGSIKLKQKCY